MALHTKAEFAVLCGLTTGNLSNYTKRGKVVLTGEFIDDTVEANSYFLEKRLDKQVEPVITVTKSETLNIETDEVEFNEDGKSQTQLDKEKKSLDIKKIREEIEILKVKKDKLHGVVIPTETVKMIIAQLFKSATSEFQSASENILLKISKKKNLNRNEMAELRGEMVDIINVAVNAAVDDSKKLIKNIINVYSEKRGVGERL